MTTPTVDIDQLRRQFPEEVVRYFDAVVSELEWRIQAMEEALPQIATDAATAAEETFEQQALAAIVAQLSPEIDEYISEWIVDTRTWARYQFYIDSQANIEALEEREPNIVYIGTETPPAEVPNPIEPWGPTIRL